MLICADFNTLLYTLTMSIAEYPCKTLSVLFPKAMDVQISADGSAVGTDVDHVFATPFKYSVMVLAFHVRAK